MDKISGNKNINYLYKEYAILKYQIITLILCFPNFSYVLGQISVNNVPYSLDYAMIWISSVLLWIGTFYPS